MSTAVLLIDPKFPHNVGGAVRACGGFRVPVLRWTGNRVDADYSHRRISRTSAGRAGPVDPGKAKRKKMRLPREERVREWQSVDWCNYEETYPVSTLAAELGAVPICVELLPGATMLPDFIHPARALYVFGPEDGNVPKGVRQQCHRFVQIPTNGCLNLAAAVNVILYDRSAKEQYEQEYGPAATTLPRYAGVETT